MGTVIAEMSSCTALTWHTWLKTAFETKNMKSKYFGMFIMKISKYKVIEENAHLKNTTHNNKELIYIFALCYKELKSP